MLFYGTPVLYPIEVVPETLRRLHRAEPAGPAVRAGAQWVIDPTRPGRRRGGRLRSCLLPPIAIFVGVCVLGVWVFNREAPRIAEQL